MTTHKDTAGIIERLEDLHDPDDARHNRVFHVEVGDGAFMTLPRKYWLWRLVHSPENTPPGICTDRQLAVGVIESFLYLIEDCTKEEAWRRIKLLRAALRARAHKGEG